MTIFNCVPIQGFWNLTIKRRCLNDPVLFVTTECFTTALDLAILLMPVYSIAHLQRSLSQKVSILSTFLLGLMYVTLISGYLDGTYEYILVVQWSLVYDYGNLSLINANRASIQHVSILLLPSYQLMVLLTFCT